MATGLSVNELLFIDFSTVHNVTVRNCLEAYTLHSVHISIHMHILKMCIHTSMYVFVCIFSIICISADHLWWLTSLMSSYLKRFDAVGWVSGRASDL